MTGCEEDAASGLSYTNDMTGGGGAKNAIVTDQKLLNSIRGSDLCDELHNFRVPVSAITTNNQERVFNSFGNGEEDGGDEGLAVVILLENLDLLAKSRCARPGIRCQGISTAGTIGQDSLLVAERAELDLLYVGHGGMIGDCQRQLSKD